MPKQGRSKSEETGLPWQTALVKVVKTYGDSVSFLSGVTQTSKTLVVPEGVKPCPRHQEIGMKKNSGARPISVMSGSWMSLGMIGNI